MTTLRMCQVDICSWIKFNRAKSFLRFFLHYQPVNILSRSNLHLFWEITNHSINYCCFCGDFLCAWFNEVSALIVVQSSSIKKILNSMIIRFKWTRIEINFWSPTSGNSVITRKLEYTKQNFCNFPGNSFLGKIF